LPTKNRSNAWKANNDLRRRAPHANEKGASPSAEEAP
jgi:hypothetical protein